MGAAITKGDTGTTYVCEFKQPSITYDSGRMSEPKINQQQ